MRVDKKKSGDHCNVISIRDCKASSSWYRAKFKKLQKLIGLEDC